MVFVRGVVDDQVIFPFIVVIEHRIKAGQTILEQQRTFVFQQAFFIFRQTKRCQVIEPFRKNNFFVLFRGVHNQIKIGIETEPCTKSGQRRKRRIIIVNFKTDSPSNSGIVDLQNTDGVHFQEASHGHGGMNVHDRTGLIDEQVESAVQYESGKGQFAHCMDEDVEFTGLTWIRRNLRCPGYDQMVFGLVGYRIVLGL